MHEHSVLVDLIDVGVMYFFIGVLVLGYDHQLRSQLTYLKLQGFKYTLVLKIAIVLFWPMRNSLKNLFHRIGTKGKDNQ